MAQRVTSIVDVRTAVAERRHDGSRIALVPTMGALHEGHLSLVREAGRHADAVVVSVFVNPTQFGAGEDLDGYPRDLDADEAALERLGDDAPSLVFAPTVAEMYPRGAPSTRVVVAGLTDRLCGASRPGHFDGVGLVVTKLHSIVRPDVAVYGRKDFQQLQVIRRIVADLDQPVTIVGAPIVRDDDGLALSSRNRYLADDDRRAARALSRALRAAVLAARVARRGGTVPDAERLHAAAAASLEDAARVRLDYLEVLDPETLRPHDRGPRPSSDPTRGAADADDRHGDEPGHRRHLVAVAAFVGPARLIDNVVIGEVDDEDRLLDATTPPTDG